MSYSKAVSFVNYKTTHKKMTNSDAESSINKKENNTQTDCSKDGSLEM